MSWFNNKKQSSWIRLHRFEMLPSQKKKKKSKSKSKSSVNQQPKINLKKL